MFVIQLKHVRMWKMTKISKEKAIANTIAKYPSMTKAKATYYVEEVLGYLS